MPEMNEADTCREDVVPKLQSAGWENDPHSLTEQRSFTDGRIIVVGSKARRQPQKRADYLLRYTCDFPIAVVEAKAGYESPGDGLQQARELQEFSAPQRFSRNAVGQRGTWWHRMEQFN